MFGVYNRESLSDVVLDEFERLASRLRKLFRVSHNDDGSLKTDALTAILGSDFLSREAPLVRRTRIINADILTMPTTGVEILPTPGVGYTNVVDKIILIKKFAAGAYTNVDNDAFFGTKYESMSVNWSSLIANIDSEALTYLDDWLGATDGRAVLREFTDTKDVTLGYGTLVYPNNETFENEAMLLYIDNAAAGNLTGGNVLNELIAYVYYHKITLP